MLGKQAAEQHFPRSGADYCFDNGRGATRDGPCDAGAYEEVGAFSADTDGDGILDDVDNCIFDANATQADITHLLAVRQWEQGIEEPASVLQLVAGTLVELGIMSET